MSDVWTLSGVTHTGAVAGAKLSYRSGCQLSGVGLIGSVTDRGGVRGV